MKIEITTRPKKDDLRTIHQGIKRYNKNQVLNLPTDADDLAFAVFARDDDNRVIGGIRATASWNWLHIELLWVAKDFRQRGIGKKLVQKAEDFAREHGFGYVRVETTSFQAKPFYEKLGYQVFGVLENSPTEGYTDYFMKKRL